MRIIRNVARYMKAFRNDIHWDVRVYHRSDFETNLQNPSKINCFELVGDNKYWYADPILFDADKHTFLFFEQYDIKARKGRIGYSEVTKEGISAPQSIIDSPFHMSFPMVFEKNGQYYLIPETEEDRTLQLYRAEKFPDKWILEKILISDIRATDTILIQGKNRDYLLVSEDRCNDSCNMVNVLYPFDLNTMSICGEGEEIAAGSVGIRNAGKSFVVNNLNIRPGQDCEGNVYGKGILFWNYSLENGYSEQKMEYVIRPEMIFGQNSKYTGTHTFSSSKDYIAVDCKRDVVNSTLRTLYLTVRFLIKRVKGKIL